MRATIRVEGLDRPRGRLRALALNLADPGEALIAAAGEIADANVARLQKGVRPKLAPGTLRRKQRLGQPRTPLIAEGKLLASLRIGGPGNILRAYKTVVRYGTSDYRAHFHDRGNGVPKRRVVTAGGKRVKVAAANAAGDRLLPGRGARRMRALDLA